MNTVNKNKIIQILRIYNTIMRKKYYKRTRWNGIKDWYCFSLSGRYVDFNVGYRNEQDFARLSKILNKIEANCFLDCNLLVNFFFKQRKLILQFYKARKTLFTVENAFIFLTNDYLHYKQGSYSAMIKLKA